MTLRILPALILALASPALHAEEPPKLELRPTLEFKDIKPHDHPEEHGEKHGEKHTTCAPAPADGGLFATAEYLLLKPRRTAFDFALTDPNRDLAPTGRVQSLNYELRSGVRGSLGYRFAESHWGAAFEYTYFSSGANRTIGAPAGGTLYATLTRPGLSDEAAAAAASAGLTYNLFDTIATRRFEIDHHTTGRVYGGFRFATIRQDFSSIYDGGDANLGLVSTASDFDGFGPLVGGDLAWSLHHGFHLYAKGSAALMTGTLRNTLNETNNAGQTVYADINDTTRRVIPTATLGIGGGWQHEHVSIRVGYEITNWFGLIDTPRFTGELAEGKFTTRNGDFSLEGIFVQLGVSY